MIRTRFAPSPTGRLHLGNARTAFFNALWAVRAGGVFVLRIEDTDADRSSEVHEAAILDDLRWLGLEWAEGPGANGAYGPYRQSERGEVYRVYLERLTAVGHAYPCFCTPQQLDAQRAAAAAAGRAPRYPGTCARIPRAEAERRLAHGEPAALRFRVPPGRTLRFEDLVRGEQQVETDDLGDFVIRRADGTLAFLFANALDDALMRVTHVLRGEDHVSNTPRQRLILEALELDAPAYGHLPLVVDRAERPLSKRSGSAAIADLRSAGILPLALRNYLLRLGHASTESGLLGVKALARAFDPQRLGRAPAHYDTEQLAHWQRLAISALDPREAAQWSGVALSDASRFDQFWHLVHGNVSERSEVGEWARVLEGDARIAPEAEEVLAATPSTFFEAAGDLADEPDFRSFTAALRERTGVSGKRLFHPLRAALTGRLDGPELARIWAYLPAERRRGQLERASTHGTS